MDTVWEQEYEFHTGGRGEPYGDNMATVCKEKKEVVSEEIFFKKRIRKRLCMTQSLRLEMIRKLFPKRAGDTALQVALESIFFSYYNQEKRKMVKECSFTVHFISLRKETNVYLISTKLFSPYWV